MSKTPKTHCEHDLQPIETEPTQENSLKVRMAWNLNQNAGAVKRCAKCGVAGSYSRGSMRGGGHRFMVHELSERTTAQVEAWNARVAADLVTPEQFGFQKAAYAKK